MSTNSSLEEKVAEFIRNGKSDAIEGKLIELSSPIFTSVITIGLWKKDRKSDGSGMHKGVQCSTKIYL
jgi:hypothetical protein